LDIKKRFKIKYYFKQLQQFLFYESGIFMKKSINTALKVLQNTGVIIYPTDTIWGIGCDATNEKAVAKIYEIKQRSESKSLIILVDSWQMLEQYIHLIPAKANCIIQGSSKPTTLIYNKPKGLAKNVIASDNTVAIRIVNDEFCKKLIHKLGKPMVSTSANYSNKMSPKKFDEIEISLLDKADYVVNLHLDKIKNQASQIIKINNKGEIIFIRK